ncbi:Abi-alpha family protein [Weissella confusa]|uniref:Abi-alpha family protein n=1 Tax=Weissella confusa TaxID=1583 RepID=UPI0018F15583|nr:Abi-alpha family protein [Weissella confusa]MBJ7658732.1 DUF4393 domain-containing protein [Weissella confusa]
MNPDDIVKTADAVKAVADAFSIPEEVKAEMLTPPATSLGQVFGAIIDLVFGNVISKGIIKRAKIDELNRQAVSFFNDHPNATYDEAKTMLLAKEIDDSKFSIDDEYMRTRFAKLIANTADSNTNSLITPYYSNVLANLSSDAAKLFEDMSTRVYTIISIYSLKSSSGGDSSINNTVVETSYGVIINTDLLNQLQALGLIAIDKNWHLKDTTDASNNIYGHIQSTMKCYGIDPDSPNVSVDFGSAWLTDFGRSFYKATHD